MSLSDKKDKNFTGVKVFHARIERVHRFVVARTTNEFFYDVVGRKYKRTLCYKLEADAELKYLKLNLSYLGMDSKKAMKYFHTMTTLLNKLKHEFEED